MALAISMGAGFRDPDAVKSAMEGGPFRGGATGRDPGSNGWKNARS